MTPKKALPAEAHMIISALSFALMSAAVKSAADIAFIQKVFFRNFVMLILILPPLISAAGFLGGAAVFLGRRENRPALLRRSLFGLAGVMLYFYSIGGLTLSDSAMLNKLSAFFVIILSAVFLGERIRGFQIPALLAAFGGALLIIKPGFSLQPLPAAAGTAASVLAAAAYTTIASLRGRENPLTIIFWFSAVSTVATGAVLPFFWRTPSLGEAAALVLTGVFAAGGQYFLTKAYSGGRAGEVSIYNYTNVVFALLVGLILWAELPDILSAAGTLLIIGAAAGLYLRRRTE